MPILTLSQSYKRQDARVRLIDLSDQMSLHMLKITLMPNNRGQDHWRGEVANWLYQADYLSSLKSGKRLKPQDLLDSIFAINEIKELKKRIVRLADLGYSVPDVIEVDLVKLREHLLRIYRDLAIYLSEGQDTKISTWRRILDKILLRYN
jgi:hypothetical protein